MTIRPLADRVVIKSVEAEEKTKTGIILTASAQEKPQIAEVVAVGPGGNVDGKETGSGLGESYDVGKLFLSEPFPFH